MWNVRIVSCVPGSPMDWAAIIDQLGGGLSAVVIAALGYAYMQERKHNRELMDRALDREREHSRELIATIDTVRTLGGRP